MTQPQDPNQFDQSSNDGGFGNDIKSEFTGNYNTGTNPVSDIFRGGGFLADSKNRIVLGVLVAVVLGIAAMMFSDSGDDFEDEDYIASEAEDSDELFDEDEELGGSEEAANDDTAGPDGDVATIVDNSAEVDDSTAAGPELADLPHDDAGSHDTAMDHGHGEEMADSVPYSAAASPPVAVSPEVGFRKSYDETSYPAEFRWEGSGGTISFSRSPDMSPVMHQFRSKENVFRYRKLLPGVWYWQVVNRAGKSEVRSFEILPPRARVLSLATPAEGDAIAGNGGVVAWTGDTRVAYYRVELGKGDWSQTPYRFATSGTQLNIRDVPAGSYQMRVGAFSEVSGRWEYTQPIAVTVQ